MGKSRGLSYVQDIKLSDSKWAVFIFFSYQQNNELFYQYYDIILSYIYAR